ncbi:autotransporter outer membrane beta-barrel domain-containing protein [Bartonella krasnovii]|uniref:autotransporter outer membrane beta-barrel domain-containing protein n=1 Tax=Bartonella krasnovii TaxID=2267275 RepID=UPI001F4CD30A|nr:autotransporter outer membrane beta-barrel domain-containing protein [Bartonella krasnovii]UNF46627.1 autotransporter outer membrane beta-barrel domain-containing protein [Bartonella krasnovii]
MINVVKNRARLCALTTSAFVFLQGVDASNATLWNSFTSMFTPFTSGSVSQKGNKAGSEAPRAEAQTGDLSGMGGGAGSTGAGVPAATGGGLEQKEGGGVGTRPGGVVAEGLSVPLLVSSKYGCNLKNYDSGHDPIYCSGDKTHTMKMSVINVKEFGDNAVLFAGGSAKSNDQAVGEKKGADGKKGLELVDVLLRGKISPHMSKMEMLNFSSMSAAHVMGTSGALNGIAQEIRSVDVGVITLPNVVKDQMENLSASGILGGVGWAVTSDQPGFGSAVFATSGAEVFLKDSNISDFIVGLEATDRARIEMVRGSITKTNVGALADLNSFIYLLNTDINVQSTQIPLGTVGLQSFGSSGIMMEGGSITFEKDGVGVWAEDKGVVHLEDVRMKIAERSAREKRNAEAGEAKKLTLESEPSSTVFLVRNGFVSTNHTYFEGSDATFLWVNEDSKVAKNVRNDTPFVSSARLKSANITVDGMSYGIYLQKTVSKPRVSAAGAKKATTEKVTISPEALETRWNSRNVVLLEDSNLRVPKGVAIYSKGLNSSVILKDETTLSGDLLLKAKYGSDLSVFVDNSEIIGAARVDGSSHAKLFLSGQSVWSVRKSLYNGSESSNISCVDSCISSMKLENSHIIFFTSEDKSASGDESKRIEYRTLRIGDKQDSRIPKGEVYTASEDSRIYFNANLTISDVGTGSPVSDRLLILGNVSGSTTVYVEDTSKSTEKNPDQGYTATLIQVFGDANQHSFKLPGGYVTRGDAPYKYILSAYKYDKRGFTNSLGNFDVSINNFKTAVQKRLFDKSLLTDATERGFWEFRLEGEIKNPERRKTPIVTPLITPGATSAETEDSGVSETSIVPLGDVNSETDSGYDVVDSPTAETENVPDVSDFEDSASLLSPQTYPRARSESVGGAFDISSGDLSELRVPVLPVQSSTSTLSDETDFDDDDDQPENFVSADPIQSNSVARSEPSEEEEIASLVSSLASKAPAPLDSAASHYDDTVSTPVEPSISTPQPKPSTPISLVSSADVNIVSTQESSAVSTQPETSTFENSVASTKVNPATSVQPKISIPVNSVALAGKNVVSTQVNPVVSKQPKVSAKPAVSSEPAVSSGRAVGRILSLVSPEKVNISAACDGTGNNGVERSQIASYSCDGKKHIVKDLVLQASDATQHLMHAKNQNTIVNLEGAIITGAANSANGVDITRTPLVSTVLAENGAEVVLGKESTVRNSTIGLEAQKGGKVKMNDGTVNASYVGALAGSGSSVNLSNTKIHVMGDSAIAGLASKAGEIVMDSGIITLTNGIAVRSELGGSIKLDRVDITAKKGESKSDETFGRSVFLVADNASVEFTNGNVTTDATALWIKESGDAVEASTSRRRRSTDVRPSLNHASIEFSTFKVEGNGAYGIYFDGTGQKRNHQQSAVSQQEKTPIHVIGAISLKKTNFEVANGIAIYGRNSGGQISLEKGTVLSGDLLLKAENNSNISVSIDNSIVKGGVRVNKDSYAKLDLINGSEWILKRSTQKDLGTPDSRCVDSCVSSVRLVNSAIDFASPESGEKYQTLHIGNGKGTVYEVQGDVVIHLNARLNPHDSSSQQVTDQLVIHGDVSGKTKIHVRGDAGNVGNAQKNTKIAHSISVIQVYGQAEKDSFQLDGDYVALRNSPYKYTLRSYSPEVTSAEQHVREKFMKDGGAFWNFRLENQYVKSAGSAALSERFVRSVVPQVPTYLVLPNSVFHTGLMDINNQNKQLETLRMTSTGMVEVRENPALYLRGYGGSYRYASDLSALEYGYDGDLDYRGVEAGVLLKTIENTDSALSFGVMGTYGKLSLKPLDVEQSQKSAFDKWTATVYGSMQHNVGFYVDGLLSYGLFKGDVLTLARGKTATLKGNPLNVSLIGGQTIATGYKGFVFDPQVQVVYQHLQFNKARDIDNFDIEMGNLDQWVARVGGRLTKNPTGSEGVNAVAFYGKLYLAHGFGEKQSVHFSDSFKLGAFGSSLEAGVGFNVKLLPQFSLHADILYQHKLNKAGFSGASFSGGVRYQF